MRRRGAVIVSLSGGVGNQLFQYAAGRTIAAEREARLEVVARPLHAARSLGIRDLVDVPKASLTPYERFLGGFPDAPLRRAPTAIRQPLKSAARRVARYEVVRQSLLEMADPMPPLDPATRYLHLQGYFQHPSYFEPVLAAIVSEIEAKLGPSLDLAAANGVVGMHFRRGDYLLYGYELPLAFHESALALIAERSPVKRVVVMGDDPDFVILAAEHFARQGFPVSEPSATRSDTDDFTTLATAQHVVMSNSTFVWWAAVLGDRLRSGDGRIVVCPTPWMPKRASATIPAEALDLAQREWVTMGFDE